MPLLCCCWGAGLDVSLDEGLEGLDGTLLRVVLDDVAVGGDDIHCGEAFGVEVGTCLLYTSDAADE